MQIRKTTLNHPNPEQKEGGTQEITSAATAPTGGNDKRGGHMVEVIKPSEGLTPTRELLHALAAHWRKT